MKGDFTRDTFLAANQFSRVLWQQGRVQLDADMNEQVSILLHYLQTLATDLIGSHGGPCENCGFEIIKKEGGDYLIGNGRYYVDGILCEVDGEDKVEVNGPVTEKKGILFSAHKKQNGLEMETGKSCLMYLDVWERLVTSLEHPLMRESALGGPDTSARAQTVWQVKVKALKESPYTDSQWPGFLEGVQPANRGLLRAKCQSPSPSRGDDPCIIPPDNVYRGQENQLYRVEIHQGGELGTASFKWSRDNGSVVFGISRTAGTTIFLNSLGGDEYKSLKVDDWVEISDDSYELAGVDAEPRPLFQIGKIDRQSQTVTLKNPDNQAIPDYEAGQAASLHALLRRWDHVFKPEYKSVENENGAIKVVEDQWLLLENGIQVYFVKLEGEVEHTYRRGDYWLIPARTVTGDIEWPKEEGKLEAKAMRPHGVTHHYAPLAQIVGNGDVQTPGLRHFFKAMAGKNNCTEGTETAAELTAAKKGKAKQGTS